MIGDQGYIINYSHILSIFAPFTLFCPHFYV